MNQNVMNLLNKIVNYLRNNRPENYLFPKEEHALWKEIYNLYLIILLKIQPRDSNKVSDACRVTGYAGKVPVIFDIDKDGPHVFIRYMSIPHLFHIPHDLHKLSEIENNLPSYFDIDKFNELKVEFLQKILNVIQPDKDKNLEIYEDLLKSGLPIHQACVDLLFGSKNEASKATIKWQNNTFIVYTNGMYSAKESGHYIVIYYHMNTDLTHSEKQYLHANVCYESLKGFNVTMIQKIKD